MRMLFLKIPAMRFYKGAVADDMPLGPGGAELDGEEVFEKYNFDPVTAPNGSFCLGWFDAGEEDALPIENLEGVDMEAELAENVLVVWCAELPDGRTGVVGWYADATVLREYDDLEFDGGYVQTYNIIDEARNCVLLPEQERPALRWNVPVVDEAHAWGLSRKNIWFPQGEQAAAFAERMAGTIREYRGENWLERYPEAAEE